MKTFGCPDVFDFCSTLFILFLPFCTSCRSTPCNPVEIDWFWVIHQSYRNWHNDRTSSSCVAVWCFERVDAASYTFLFHPKTIQELSSFSFECSNHSGYGYELVLSEKRTWLFLLPTKCHRAMPAFFGCKTVRNSKTNEARMPRW